MPGVALYYMALGAIIVVIMVRIVVIRARYIRPGELPRPYGHIELALICETTTRAVLASLGFLRAAGAVDAGDRPGLRHRILVAGSLPAGASAVDAAVYDVVVRRQPTWHAIESDPAVQAAVTAVEAELRAAGALTKALDKRFYNRAAWSTISILFVGAALVPVAWGDPPWVGLALLAAAAPFVVLAVVFVTLDNRRSRLGKGLRTKTLAQRASLDLGRAVAVRGVAALWDADRPFAERARLPHDDPDALSGGSDGGDD